MTQPPYFAPEGGLPPQTRLMTGRAVFTTAYAVIPKGCFSDILTSALPGWAGTKLWLIAASLETDKDRKSKVLKKALQSVPQSDKLWKELIDTAADDQEAIDFLTHAVECVPVYRSDTGQPRLPPRSRSTAAVQRSQRSHQQGEPALQE